MGSFAFFNEKTFSTFDKRVSPTYGLNKACTDAVMLRFRIISSSMLLEER